MDRNGFSSLIVISIIAILTIASAAGYFGWKKSLKPQISVTSSSRTSTSPTPIISTKSQDRISNSIETTGLITYQGYNFKFQYPNNWNIIEIDSNPFRLIISNYSKNQYVHGVGVPDVGGVEVEVAQGTLPVCSNDAGDFVSQADQPDVGLQPYDKYICDGKNTIILSYTDSASNPLSQNVVAGDKALLQKIADSVVESASISDTTCHDSTKYFIVSKSLTDSVGSDILVKYKTNPNQSFPCTYTVGSGDFEIKNGDGANYYLNQTMNFLLLDSGTGPDPRGLSVYDLNKQKDVFDDQYSEPVTISGNSVTYWAESTIPATQNNCPQINEWASGGLGAAIDKEVTLNLETLIKTEDNAQRCSVRQ